MDRREQRGVGTGNPTMDRQEADREEAPREAAERAPERREPDAQDDPREEDGWGQPESSAQKGDAAEPES
jgi:hypothetical protein